MRVIYWVFRLLAVIALCVAFLNAMGESWKIAFWANVIYCILALLARVFKRSAEIDEMEFGKRRRTDHQCDYGPAGADDGDVIEEKAP